MGERAAPVPLPVLLLSPIYYPTRTKRPAQRRYIDTSVCVFVCVCVRAYVCNLCVYPHASVLCGTNRGLPWSAFGASSPIGVKEVRLVRSTNAGLISWGTSFTGTSGLECLTTKSIGLAPIPVVLTPRPPRGSSSAIVMDFHHTLRDLTPTLSDSALVLSGNSLAWA